MDVDRARSVTEPLTSAEANRRFYESHAAIYDETEFCAESLPREQLASVLRRALAALGEDPRCLDAGGGTGNASLMLLEMGVEPVLVDASPEMLARWEHKAASRGHAPISELVDLETFFDGDERRWDLVVFSSVLHHLEVPRTVLLSAAKRLTPGGVIVTIFDPLEVGRIGHLLRRVDYAIWIAVHSPATLVEAILRRLRMRVRGAGRQEQNLGAMAERHAMSGLDDGLIRRSMEAEGLRILGHDRLYDARYRWIAAISRGLRQPTHFSFILQLPVGDVQGSPT